MSEDFHYQKSGDPSNDPQLWKVEPGFAIGFIQLGTPRHELFQILRERNFEAEDADLEESEFYVVEMATTLYFGIEHPYPLELIEVDDDRARFGTLKVLGDYPHNIFASIPSTGTAWFEDLSQISHGFITPTPKKTVTDESLLDSGTLWMTDLGFGFRLTRGIITTLFLCDPSKLPEAGDGEFTGAQRHLSERMQIASFRSSAAKSHPLETTVKIALFLTAILVAAFFGKQAWEEQNRWDNAIEVEADVVAVSPPPPEPLPDKFQLTYQDKSGTKHELELDRNDVYGVPRVGEKVTLRYLPESPETVKGPTKVHDIGFERFVPYLLSTLAVYMVMHFMSDYFLGHLLKKP
jgi:hypothetical protein